MFFVGISCTLFPYILAVIFAGLLLGGATQNDFAIASTSAETKIVEYNPFSSQAASAFQYQLHQSKKPVVETTPPVYVKPSYWGESSYIPLRDICLINPIKRGPPQVTAIS
ncbi:MAG: hypothetical protein JW783_10820 [Bacteroidales bacterium]|nr:hypothetical protein [Bacteroidales bacterium]MBN2749087.1 hypothetical protein [Bacteroidales bacterium]